MRPLEVTHTFRDRLQETQSLCSHLIDSHVRLVSVVGRSGMGKTALVSRVMADLERGQVPSLTAESEFPMDGIIYLSARSTGLGLERIYTDVGRMLGEPAATDLAFQWKKPEITLPEKVEHLLETMQNGRYLILLDNLEDELTEDGAIRDEGLRVFVERCLLQDSGMRLIVTSREHVKLAAAALHRSRTISLLEGLPENEAIALLRDLDPQGALGLRGAPDTVLRRAAQLTQGIPRALEILAGILYNDPTASLSELLADERGFREHVVNELVAVGYRSLGKDEQRVLEALAVFDRPMQETAIAYLLHPWFPDLDTHRSLRRLMQGYFVNMNKGSGEFDLHPLDREYAYHQIPEETATGELGYTRKDLELRAAEFYASIRKAPDLRRTIDDLAPQLDELEHRIRGGDYHTACRILDAVDADYLYLWGHYSWLRQVRERLIGHLEDPALQASNLSNLGRVYRALGQVDRAVGLHEEGLAISRRTGDRASEQTHLTNLGSAYRTLGEINRSIQFYEQARVIARERGDRKGESVCTGSLATAQLELGHFEQAIDQYQQAIAIARETGDRAGERDWIGHSGRAYHGLGQFEKAIACLTSRWPSLARLGRKHTGSSGSIALAARISPWVNMRRQPGIMRRRLQSPAKSVIADGKGGNWWG